MPQGWVHVIWPQRQLLEENEKAEEDANAVLGASDDQNCIYFSVSRI